MAHGHVAYNSHKTSTDAAMVDITVRLDTGQWSNRKKNIVTRCIDTVILDCGYKTADMVGDIMEANDIPVRYRRMYVYDSERHNYLVVSKDTIDPLKLDDLTAIVAARCKINASNSNAGFEEQQFINSLEGTNKSYWMAERMPFYKDMQLEDWIHPEDEAQREKKHDLVSRIRGNQIITAIYKP